MLTLVPKMSFRSSSTLTTSGFFLLEAGFLFFAPGLPAASFSASLTESPSLIIFSQIDLLISSSEAAMSVLPCPAEILPSAMLSLMYSGSLRSLMELVIYGLLFPTLLETCSCVIPKVSVICLSPSASSIGFRSSLCIFSIIAISIFCSSSRFLMRHGTWESSAFMAALHLLSPATIS